ncbi:MAG TPA: efflux RND transporter periplasmic adaptor subunit [Candidatus Limnocylindrales bacterium]
MRLKLVAVVLLIAVGLGTAVWAMGGLSTGAAATPQDLTGTVTRGDVTQNAAATGTIATTASYGLTFGAPPRLIVSGSTGGGSSTTTWHVTSVSAKVGATVRKGATLAVASTTDLSTQLADATTSVRAARIQLLVANTQLTDATTTAQIRQARISVYNAQSQLSQAEQKRADLVTQIAAATIKSPIDGTVVTVNVAPGLDAPSGDAIVVNASSLEVTADVVESDLPNVKVGQAAQVTVSAVGLDLAGSVATVAPVATSTSGSNSVVSYAVTVTLDDPSGRVRPGMSANVSISTAAATNVLTVPTAALVGANGTYVIRLLGADGSLSTQPVTVGLVTNTRAEVTAGVTEGETVVTGVATAQTTTTTTGGGGLGGGGLVPGAGGGRGFGGGGGTTR